MWTDRQAIEVFHLLFLRSFGARVDKTLFALKGGCNLRFFHRSIRYSEDMDLDIRTMAPATLRSNVMGRSSETPRSTRFALTVFTELPNDGRSRMSWSEGNDEDPSSPTFYFGGADDRVFRVIAALDDDVRTKMADKIERRIVRENYDEIDAFERTQHVRPLGVGAHGTCRAF